MNSNGKPDCKLGAFVLSRNSISSKKRRLSLLCWVEIGRKKRWGNVLLCHGIFGKEKGISNWRLRLHFIGNVLEKYGFSRDELIKERMCTVEGCRFSDTLEFLIFHLNVKHRLLAKKIADYVEKMEHDKRELPPWWKRLYNEWKFGA